MLPILSILGLFTAAYLLYKIADVIALYTRPCTLRRYLHKSPKGGQPAWALVTGASDGIGKALAHELAARGFHVALHGRNAAKLTRVRAELSRAHPHAEFRVVVADAVAPDPDGDAGARLAADLADLHLTVVINNAGGGITDPMFAPLEARDPRALLDNVRLNAVFPTVVLHALLPVLARHGGPALVVNVGSITDNGLPLLATYAASKAYLRTLTESLAREALLRGADLEAMHMRVGSVVGTAQMPAGDAARPGLFSPSAETFAPALLARVGCGRTVVFPWWPHLVMQTMLLLMPEGLRNRAIVAMMAKVSAQPKSQQQRKSE